jgi:hypothetical protein
VVFFETAHGAEYYTYKLGKVLEDAGVRAAILSHALDKPGIAP